MTVLLPALGDYGFWDPWEPKYAQSVREMHERGSYFIPYYRGAARLAKPILTYWSIMAGSAVFGLNEFGARIGGVCAALASLLAVYYAVSRIRGRRAGILSAIVVATLPQFYFIARQAAPDVFVFVGIGLRLLFLALGVFVPDQRRSAHLLISYVCLALSVLAKGPIVSGGIFCVTLGLLVLVHFEWRWLWRPEVRRETSVLLATAVPLAVTVAVLAFTALLMGTGPKWWGWPSAAHEILLSLRGGIVALASRFRIADALLILAALVVASHGVNRIRHGLAIRQGGRVGLALIAPALVLLVAARGLLESDPARRVLIASSLGALTGLGMLAVSAWRYVRLPRVWDAAGMRVGFLGRQVLTFAVTMLVIAGPWYGVVLAQKSVLFVNDFIVYNHITRATEEIHASGAYDYYLHVLAYGLFPWSCLLPIALAVRGRNPFKKFGVETFLGLAGLWAPSRSSAGCPTPRPPARSSSPCSS
jgi:4-amino-4-deoxy-L-arabinose transferase-like glycosyltransferase